MDIISKEKEPKFQSAHQLHLSTKKSFRNLDIPPHKLLTRRLAALSSEPSMEMYHQIQHQRNESPKVLPEETLFQKFLPNSAIDDASDPYASDEFRMYEFKIRKCTRSRSHDWTDCPYAHPGEKARRRCPRRFNYSGNVCADFRRGSCIRGDTCEFAHGVFECWLHPSRYRTEACKDGKDCRRKICFFAHDPTQLRSLPPEEMVVTQNKHFNVENCCYSRCYLGIRNTSSPKSILEIDKLSPPPSPPFSPAKTGGGSRFSDRLVRKDACGLSQLGNPGSNYKDSKKRLMNHRAIEELMNSMKVMNMNANDQISNLKLKRSDLFTGNNDQQSFFIYSPSTPSMNAINEERYVKENSTSDHPDIEWVDDLLT